MIDFKLRQEKVGGYLLNRLTGQATRVSQAAHDMLVDLYDHAGDSGDDPSRLIEKHFGDDALAGEGWWQKLRDVGLGSRSGLQSLQVIPLVGGPTVVPDDCLAAPARVYFELTRRCNLSCRSCFNNSHHPLPNELSTAEILIALDELNHLGTFEIRFTGGEPSEHPDFREIVTFAKSLGFYISMGTNGVFSEEKRGWIYESGVDWFIVSLDGTEEINDRIRGKGTYRQVLRTLSDLSHHPHLRVRLNMVIARHNIHAIATLAQLADSFGVESLNMIPLRPYGRSTAKMVKDMFDQEDFYGFIQRIRELRQCHRVEFITTLDLLDPEVTTSRDPIAEKKQSCAAGIEATVIGATGDVYGCSYSPASFPGSTDVKGRKMFVAGNLRQDSLRTIWLDSERWAVFRYLDIYKNSRCLTCDHYRVRCVGSCPIMGYFQAQQPDAFDPYCFADLLPRKSSKPA